jgi:hypothetical protein
MIELCVACHECESCMHVCLLCVVSFSGDRIEQRVCGGGGDLNIKKKEIRDKPTKESHLLVAYLNPNISPCMDLLMFSNYALFSILLLFPI